MHLHRYNNWADGIAGLTGLFSQLAGPGLVQFRYCRKCNKRQVRTVKA